MIAQRQPPRGPQARYRWRPAPPVPEALRRELGLPDPVLGALAALGHRDPRDALAFLAREPGRDDPFRLAGMVEAVDRLRRALRGGERIGVYGDYDADGVTATALLCQCLRALGGEVRPFIPHREREGYGLNAAAILRLADEGVRLLVTVDCGVRAAGEIALARSRGMDVIVTDHHALPEDLPEALALVNPRRPDCDYGDQDLAGVGLAFKLAQALLRVAAALGEAPALAEEDLLDLVALGTVADVVPLRGENRSLVHRGLGVLRRARRPGLAALLQQMGQAPEGIDAGTIAFGLGPRLNAAGRMDDAGLALELLLAPGLEEALPLAARLEAVNSARRAAMQAAVEGASARIEARDPSAPFLLDASPDLPLGVVGLVAGRLCERYRRPAAVLRIEGDRARGSARSIPEFDVIAALDAEAALLQRHGGHARAAGFTIATEAVPRLAAALSARAARQLAGLDLRPELEIAARLGPADIDRDLHAALEELSPFGEGNPRPVLLWRQAPVGHARCVGRDASHLKLVLEGGPGIGSLDAIAFGRGADLPELGARVDLAFELEVDRWQGRERLQLMVRDLAAP